jgi:TIR domain
MTAPKHIPTKPATMRDTVMISHANPEDNEFTLWLALQLAKDGYKVWSDVTDLIGGEQFWSDIEYVIRNRAIKFIYVLSRTSNESDRGFRKELHLADSEAKKIARQYPHFVLPVAIDDLPPSEYNILLQQLNCVRSQDWSNGLRDILKGLRKDKVPQFQDQFNPSVISAWWRRFRSAKAGITRKPDHYLSNWFPIEVMPATVYWHKLERADGKPPVLDFEMPFTFVPQGEFLFTFATEPEVSAKAGNDLRVVSSDSFETQAIINASPSAYASGPNFKHLLIELLGAAWESWIDTRSLGIYQLSNRRKCYFFKPQDDLEPLRVSFIGIEGEAAWRHLTGTFTRRSVKTPDILTTHCWHYAVHAKPRLWPSLVFHVSAHVLFSDDGKHIWESKRRLHSARRRHCKSWYNDEWRDRLLAAMVCLTGGAARIEIPVSESASLQVSPSPVAFESKITCTPVEKVVKEVEDIEGGDEDEEEGDSESGAIGGVSF